MAPFSGLFWPFFAIFDFMVALIFIINVVYLIVITIMIFVFLSNFSVWMFLFLERYGQLWFLLQWYGQLLNFTRSLHAKQ